jgi:pilus assembly protein CpaD
MTRNHLKQTARHLTANARRGLLLVVAATALASCQTWEDKPNPIATDYRQRHPISIVEKDRTLQIFVGSARNGLTPDQRLEVLTFAQGWRGEGTGRFIIDQPHGARNAGAAAAALGEIRSILGAAGVPARAVSVKSYRAERNTLAVIRINYPHTAAEVGPCGQWPDDLGAADDKNHFENVQYWNFGCATRRNVAAMVANPSDLVQPRSESPTYAARRATALEKYRKGESPATTYPESNKGAISDLGK